MKAVILAGGFGSRMGDICLNTPKPLIEILSKPILSHQIDALKKEGITDFLIVTGYLAEKIEDYFGDGQKFGVNISYYREETPLGTAGALFRLNLQEDFLLCNGDLIFDIDLCSMLNFHKAKGALATLFAHPNNHPQDSMVLQADNNNRIIDLHPKKEKPEFYPNLCNAGIQIVSPELLKMYNYTEAADFDRDVISPAINTGRIFAYRSSEYVHDMGTPERLAQTEKDISSGMVQTRNKHNLQKAIFLDRDGTLNTHKGYITNPSDIELTDGAAKSITTFHNLGYLVILITNQPVIARGDCTVEELEKIHNRLEMLLSENGAYLDCIYYCPHHPDKGFKGEVTELKIQCDCRKPAPGLIFKAQKDFNIDLSKSYMVGDSITDAEAGANAGCVSVLIGRKNNKDYLSFDSLHDFSNHLLLSVEKDYNKT